MPHRVSEFVERCCLCDEKQSTACRRCGRPLCKKHQPSKRHRCSKCESEYELVKSDYRQRQFESLRDRQSERVGAPLLGLAIGSVAGAFIGFSQSVPWTLAVVVPVVFLGVLGVALSRRQGARERALELERSMRVHRQKFLEARPRHQLKA